MVTGELKNQTVIKLILTLRIVKRLRRAAAWPAALPWRFAGVGPCRHGLGFAALAAKDFADVDWLVAMRAFVGCCHWFLVYRSECKVSKSKAFISFSSFSLNSIAPFK